MTNNITQVSKLISFWLRHDPSNAGLIADEFGWVNLAELLNALNSKSYDYTIKQLLDLNLTFDKVRWEFDDKKEKIRATHGHSFPVLLNKKAERPPETLYHGTAVSNIADIIISGLKPMKRQFVHLSANSGLALEVAKRHGKPILIEIGSAKLHQMGKIFYNTSENIWLIDAISPLYLTFEPWYTVNSEEKTNLLDELIKEICHNHVLYGKTNNLELLMRRYDRDDCLFINNITGEAYEVHLTWSPERESDPKFPRVSTFESLNDWVNKGLLTDHEEWYN